MNIGIITFTEGYNYGNKLQNYALLKFLQEMNNTGKVITVNNYVSTVKLKHKIIIKLKSLVPSKRHRAYRIRKKRFKQFNNAYLELSQKKMFKTTHSFPEVDCFVCGSDQIWNPHYYNCIDVFVGNIGEKKKSISYAASFGVSEIPNCEKSRYRKSLNYLSAISVREEQGKVICAEMGVSNVKVHIDPVFLVDKEEWIKLKRQPNIQIPQEYVFTYFIGEISNEAEREIARYCEKHKCQRMDLNFLNCLEYFTFNPFEFLYLLERSLMVFTDSFHASAFSIIFNKKFLVFKRVISENEQMHSRIETLLRMFDLQNHYYNFFDGCYEKLSIDEGKAKKVIKTEKRRSKKYFEENIFNEKDKENFV